MQTYALPSLYLGAFTVLIVYFTCMVIRSSLIAENTPTDVKGSKLNKVFIPNLLARWPWPRRVSPHYPIVAKESNDWITSLGAFSPEAQHAFDLCYISLLGCLTYPEMRKEHVRIGCDYMNMVLVVDEYTDTPDPSKVLKLRGIVMDALYNPHKLRPKGEMIVGEVVRQFWERVTRTASKQSQKRFIAAFDEFLEGVTEQANDRTGRPVRDVKGYLEVRRKTVASIPAFALMEMPFDIPDGVMLHPAIQEMVLTATEMISIANDVASYNIEQCRGDGGHNIITIVMNEFDTDVNGAMIWTQNLHTKLEQRFLAAMASLPEWDEPLNSQVKEYCNGLANGVRANHEWNFENERYFGKRGPEIKEKGWMDLMPKRKRGKSVPVGPMLVDSSAL